jgi:predicted nucleotidyltransferase
MLITFADLKAKKNAIIQTSLRHHAKNIRVFGSIARGEATENSDVDLLVSFLPQACLFDQLELIEELSTLLQTKVDVISERALHPFLQQKILKEALPL